MRKALLLPYPDSVYRSSYVFGEAVPVNIFIDGKKVEAPKAGVKIGQPMFPDIQGDAVAVSMGDYINDKED